MILLIAMMSAATSASSPSPPHDPVPIGDPGDWISSDDYPPAALKKSLQGVVGFELGVDALGIVERCRITATSGSALLDGAACGLLTARAHFSPAVDATGHAVPGVWSSAVRWQVPHSQRAAIQNLQPYAFTIQYEITAEGYIRHCQVLRHSGAAEVAANACRSYRDGVQIAPFRDATGKLVPKMIMLSSELEVRDP